METKAKVVSVVNTKGGTGKSTVATNLACIAASRGLKVLLIDADGRQASSLAFRKTREEVNNERAENNKEKEKDEVKPLLAEFAAVSVPSKTLYKDIETLANSYNLVVIDAGAGDNSIVRAAIACARYGLLVVPCQPSPFDIYGLTDTLDILDECRQTLDIPAIVFLNRVFANSRIKLLKEAKDSIEEVMESYKVERAGTDLTEYLAYKNAPVEGMSVVEYEPDGKAAMQILELYNEIMFRIGKR